MLNSSKYFLDYVILGFYLFYNDEIWFRNL